MKLPTPQTHPNFPLWPLGYTPEQVFELFFPAHFRFLCNPSRPSVCGRFGPPEDRLWRFEFVVQKDEDPQKMATPEEARRIIFPYITHPGSRYGLTKPVQFPEDCIICLRSRPFSFLARSCNRWVDGRVILAGDAAHVFPPFGMLISSSSHFCKMIRLNGLCRWPRYRIWIPGCHGSSLEACLSESKP